MMDIEISKDKDVGRWLASESCVDGGGDRVYYGAVLGFGGTIEKEKVTRGMEKRGSANKMYLNVQILARIKFSEFSDFRKNR